MGFLTIEHYRPKEKPKTWRYVLILFFLFVVPMMVVAFRAVGEARMQALAVRNGENIGEIQSINGIAVRD